MYSSHWNLQILRLTVSKTSVVSVIFNFHSLSTQACKPLVPLSCWKKLQVALFKNWINVLEIKNSFSTYLHFRLFLTEEILFLSNILTSGKFQKIYLPEKFWERLLPIYFFTKEHPLKKSNKRTHIPFLITSVLIFRIVLYWFNTISY